MARFNCGILAIFTMPLAILSGRSGIGMPLGVGPAVPGGMA